MTRPPALLLVAHGTRDPAGVAVLRRLATAVGQSVRVPVRLAFVDVLGPDPAAALATLPGPVVVVPCFLAAGYHVRVDLPRRVAATGRTDVLVTPPLGPDRSLLAAVADRLAAAVNREAVAAADRLAVAAADRLAVAAADRQVAGDRVGEVVVLAAAGSSDPHAVADVGRAAETLRSILARPVRVGYVATAVPDVPSAVRHARLAGARSVTVAPWLLAPGLFSGRLAGAGADLVSEPLGTHQAVVDLVRERYLAATLRLPLIAPTKLVSSRANSA